MSNDSDSVVSRREQLIFDLGQVAGMLLRYQPTEIRSVARESGLRPEYKRMMMDLADALHRLLDLP